MSGPASPAGLVSGLFYVFSAPTCPMVEPSSGGPRRRRSRRGSAASCDECLLLQPVDRLHGAKLWRARRDRQAGWETRGRWALHPLAQCPVPAPPCGCPFRFRHGLACRTPRPFDEPDSYARMASRPLSRLFLPAILRRWPTLSCRRTLTRPSAFAPSRRCSTGTSTARFACLPRPAAATALRSCAGWRSSFRRWRCGWLGGWPPPVRALPSGLSSAPWTIPEACHLHSGGRVPRARVY